MFSRRLFSRLWSTSKCENGGCAYILLSRPVASEMTLHVIDTFYLDMVNASIIKEYNYSYEQLLSDEFWEKHVHEIVCVRFSDEERGKMSVGYSGPMIDHFVKECAGDSTKEICVRLNKGAIVYYEMVERYKEECIKSASSNAAAHAFKRLKPSFGK